MKTNYDLLELTLDKAKHIYGNIPSEGHKHGPINTSSRQGLNDGGNDSCDCGNACSCGNDSCDCGQNESCACGNN